MRRGIPFRRRLRPPSMGLKFRELKRRRSLLLRKKCVWSPKKRPSLKPILLFLPTVFSLSCMGFADGCTFRW